MARYRVLVSDRALIAYLELPLWETARAALRLLADDPRPSWAARTTVGFTFYLPDRSWVAYVVDDDKALVSVLGAGTATGAEPDRHSLTVFTKRAAAGST